jgi:hypothetical protein
VANCDPLGLRLLYSKNSATYTAVPSTCGADEICFYGTSTDPDILTGAVSCCLTGALTQNDGGTQFTADAIPVFDLGQDGSVVHRYVLKIGSSATAGTTYDFRVYSQDGNVLNTYTTTPRLTVQAMSMGVGF